jgi:epoxyqueuosine reductase
MNENPTPGATTGPPADLAALARDIKSWGRELGFGKLGIAQSALPGDEAWLKRWLALGRHGEMAWMARHGTRRSRPAELLPGTLTVIAARMDYLPPDAADPAEVLSDEDLGYISRYALGRDYHKVLRSRLQRLADRIGAAAGAFGYRVFTDSAPVLEKALARDAGLGWIGKHTNLLAREAGSWFFLGEIFTDLPLPADSAPTSHCGSCTACIAACPTGAIVAPYELDARLCISYLTIEHAGAIPEPLRDAFGNRIYGCDDCQLACPWNRYARVAAAPDFRTRGGLDAPRLTELFGWSERVFLARTEGSAIRRIGHERWLRNIAVALGNAAPDPAARAALAARADHPSALVREHVAWALAKHDRALAALTSGGATQKLPTTS